MWEALITCVCADVLDVVALAVREVGALAAGVQLAGEVVPQVLPPVVLADGGVWTQCALKHPAHTHTHTAQLSTCRSCRAPPTPVLGLPVVVALLAVVLQVGDVVVEAVGVVAAAFAPDQAFGVARRRRSLAARLRVTSLGGARVLGPAPAATFYVVHHHHLAGAVCAQVFHKLLLVLSLEMAGFTVEGLLLLLATFAILLGGLAAGQGAGLSSLRWVFVPVLRHRRLDFCRWFRRLRAFQDAELLTVLVVETVPGDRQMREQFQAEKRWRQTVGRLPQAPDILLEKTSRSRPAAA